MQDFFKDLHIPTLPPDQVSGLDKPITQQKIIDAIQSQQTRKSPGPDGLPSEFYKAFSTLLTTILPDMYSDSMKSGSLPASLNQACIILLAKN